jgi:hypothetical protein
LQTTIADIDNDGDNDVVSSTGHILINKGNLEFELSSTLYPKSQYPVFTLDIDNDGVLEILNGGRVYKRTQIQPLIYNVIPECC